MVTGGDGFRGKFLYVDDVAEGTVLAGQPRRALDTARAHELFGFVAGTSFHHGLRCAVEWHARRTMARVRG